MKRWPFILLFIGAVALVAGAGYWGFRSSGAPSDPVVEAPQTVTVAACDVQQSVVAPGNLVNMRQVSLEMPADGNLQEILVRPGDPVREGQALARVRASRTTEEIAVSVSDAKLVVIKAQQALDELYANAEIARTAALSDIAAYAKQVRDAQYQIENYTMPLFMQGLDAIQAVDQTKAELDAALAAFEPYKYYPASDARRQELLERLNEAQSNYDSAVKRLNYEYTLEVAQANLEAARQEYDQYKDGPAASALSLAQAELDNAQAKLALAERDLEVVEVKAPFDGVVLEVSARPGETLAAHSKLIELNDPRQVEVEATVTEEDFPLLKPGMSAQVYFTARPDVVAQGQVERIVPKLLEGSAPTYEIFIRLDAVPEGLVDGMTVDASVIIASRPGALCLPRSLAHASADNQAVVQVWNGAQIEDRQITIGLRGDSQVEVLSGLKEGEQVVVR